MKGIVIILVMISVYLFYPTYDMQVRPDPFASEYSVWETGFVSEGRCHQAAATAKKEFYRCVRKTIWEAILDTSSSYDPNERYGGAQ